MQAAAGSRALAWPCRSSLGARARPTALPSTAAPRVPAPGAAQPAALKARRGCPGWPPRGRAVLAWHRSWTGDRSSSCRLHRLRAHCVPERISQDAEDAEPAGEDDGGDPSARRSTSLTFTCNKCGGRTTRMVSPDALRRGTVYVQCSSCEQWHQLVDNLNLVHEYDLTDEAEDGGGQGGDQSL